MRRTIYDITNDFMELLSMMEDPEIDPEIIEGSMLSIDGELSEKAESYIVVDKELEADLDKIQKEVDRLNRIAESIKNNRKRIRDVLMSAMVAVGKDKMPTEHFKISIVKNGGKQPLKITGDVPEEFMKLIIEPDTDKIRDALKNGELPFAYLAERGTHLSIR